MPSDPDIPMTTWSVHDAQTLMSPFNTSDSQTTKLLKHECHQPVWEPRAACWLVSQVRLRNQIQSQLCHLELSHLGKLVPILSPHFLSVIRITSNPRVVINPWDDKAKHLAQSLTHSRYPVKGTLNAPYSGDRGARGGTDLSGQLEQRLEDLQLWLGPATFNVNSWVAAYLYDRALSPVLFLFK